MSGQVSQQTMAVSIGLQTIIRVQLALLYVNKICTLRKVMLHEFQMGCDAINLFSLWFWAAVRWDQA